jgi:hypothetical protein
VKYILQLKQRLKLLYIPLMNKETKVLHINVNRNPSTTEHILQLAIELHIQIVAVQEPWTIKNNSNEYRSINHPSFI